MIFSEVNYGWSRKRENKIKKVAKEVRKQPIKNIKKEIEQNYEIGIEYFMNLDEYESLKDSD